MSAELTLLEQEDRVEERRLYPAPWTVQGSCYVVLLRTNALTDRALFVPETLQGKRQGQMLSLCFFDYQVSACGPYQELIIAPAFDFRDGQYSSVTRAYASTPDSVANIRRNWGVPVDHAEFSCQRVTDKRDSFVLSRAGRAIAELEFEHSGFSLPVTTAVLPADLRTMVQHWRGKEYRLALQAKGKMKMAKLRRSRFDSAFFPDVSQATVTAAAYLPSFELKLPPATPREI